MCVYARSTDISGRTDLDLLRVPADSGSSGAASGVSDVDADNDDDDDDDDDVDDEF